MAECHQFQMMPQVVPIYRPPPPTTAFQMTGQPMFPMPAHFGFPPVTWSPIPHYPPPLPHQQAVTYDHQGAPEEDDEYNMQLQHHNQATYENNGCSPVMLLENLPNELQHPLTQHPPTQHPHRQIHLRNYANMPVKFDTRHEEFRKYLEEMGILTTFTNILADMYQDPLRPSDPLEYIRGKLCCSRPETSELSNLRLWCEKYQTKTVRLEKELKNVIERLNKYEPYVITDETLFDENSSEHDCKTCIINVAKQGHISENKEENANCESIKNNNQ